MATGSGCTCPSATAIYADLMLLDLFLRERARGDVAGLRGGGAASTSWPGRRSTGGSTSTSSAPLYDGGQGAAAGRAPRRRRRPTLAGEPVVRTQVLSTNDGFKWFLADGSWLLVRASGTEPLVRVYTEATTPGAPRRAGAHSASGSSAAADGRVPGGAAACRHDQATPVGHLRRSTGRLARPRGRFRGCHRAPGGVGFAPATAITGLRTRPDGGPRGRPARGDWRYCGDALLSHRQGREGKSLRSRAGSHLDRADRPDVPW